MANLRNGMNNDGGRFVSIPAFTNIGGRYVTTKRQCTREYKIQPIVSFVRREILKLKPKKRIPKGTTVTQLFGFSVDEASRAARMRKHETKNWRFEFPLFNEDLLMRKSECRAYMADWCRDFEWRWSSCRSCPYHSDTQWLELKAHSPTDFEEACQNDEALRTPNNVVNRGMDNPMFIHKSCKPLREVDFTKGTPEMFDLICDGGCLT